MNLQKGNMYAFVTHTWNPIKGDCIHDCVYCYMKISKQKPLRLVKKELSDNLGQGNFIFVGSSTDMFAEDVPREWISAVLAQCRNYEGNTYLFQSKNPSRFGKFRGEYPKEVVFGTTLETNRDMSNISKAQSAKARVSNMQDRYMHRKMVTIEPILDFDLEPFVDLIKEVNPEWVAIGADSKNHNLPEPSKEKIQELIQKLNEFTEVKIKKNLERLQGTTTKWIKIFVGDDPIGAPFEEHLHPRSQIKKAEAALNKEKPNYVIYTNSVYVTEYFNKYGKQKGYKIVAYLNRTKTDLEKVFESFSEPFNKLVFDNEKR